MEIGEAAREAANQKHRGCREDETEDKSNVIQNNISGSRLTKKSASFLGPICCNITLRCPSVRLNILTRPTSRSRLPCSYSSVAVIPIVPNGNHFDLTCSSVYPAVLVPCHSTLQLRCHCYCCWLLQRTEERHLPNNGQSNNRYRFGGNLSATWCQNITKWKGILNCPSACGRTVARLLATERMNLWW